MFPNITGVVSAPPTHGLPSPSLPQLPDDWNSLTPAQQTARIMETCLATARDTRMITEQLNTLTATVQHNTAASSFNSSEIESLKNLRTYAQPVADIIVTGIPDSITLPYRDIVLLILRHLDLAGLNNDILDTRKVEKKPSPDTTNTQPNATNAQPANQSPSHNVFSIIVKFKSVEIRNFIIDAKRRAGTITVADIFPDAGVASTQGTIYVNELLPTCTYVLYKKTKKQARELKYARVWMRNGSIFVRKTATSKEIPIATENDLNKLT